MKSCKTIPRLSIAFLLCLLVGMLVSCDGAHSPTAPRRPDAGPTSGAESPPTPSSDPAQVGGRWVGTFDTSDPADCHTDTPADASLHQSGVVVTGELNAVQACGLEGVVLEGEMDGNRLNGTLSRTGGFRGTVHGTAGDDSLELGISDLRSGNQVVPAGKMHLRRAPSEP
jgi:hypothetical protein